MSRILDVYLHNFYAGQLIQNTSGQLSFIYDQDYISNHSMAISLSLPIKAEPYTNNKVRSFFSGLLPDDILRHRLAKYLGVSEKNPFALLECIGGECAGALSLYPHGQLLPPTTDHDIEILDDTHLQDIIALLKQRPLLAGNDDLRLSLAGAQDKLAVTVVDNSIALVRGATPTTHIIKPPISDITDSVHNEFFCMRLASLMGIDVPDTQIRYIGETFFLLVERYDRVATTSNQINRLHQEDFCQALGVMPELKYEREGGPNIMQCLDILGSNAEHPANDQLKLLERVIFNYLIGNADAHGKNFSLLYKNKPMLAPAYDLLSTAIYPNLSDKMAMKIGGKYQADDVLLRHWYKLVPDTKAAQRNLAKQLLNLANQCLTQSQQLKQALVEQGVRSIIFDQICAVIAKRAGVINKIVE